MNLSIKQQLLDDQFLAQSPRLVRAVIIISVLAANIAIGMVVIHGDHTVVPLVILAVSVAIVSLFMLNRIGRSELGLLLIPLSAGLLNVVTLPDPCPIG